MKKGWIQTFKRLTLVLTILVSFIAVLQAGILSWRPMFYNQLVMHDGMPFLHWWPQGPYLDDSGNAAIADYQPVFRVRKSRQEDFPAPPPASCGRVSSGRRIGEAGIECGR